MRPDLPLTRDLLLIGGGHTHALVLRRWAMDPLPGARLTLVNPGATAPYSGMLPGHVAGHYTRDALDIDLVRLCRFAGAGFIDGAVSAIDPEARSVTIPGRPPLRYDVASLDIGIHAEMPDLPGFDEHAVGAKPLGRFADAWRAFLAQAGRGDRPPTVALIGGGVAGVELSMAMAHALRAAGCDPSVTVVEAAAGIAGTGPEARRRLRAAMQAQGVALRVNARVAEVSAAGLRLEDGSHVEAAFVTGAAGARPHGWLASAPLPTENGFVRVDSRLRVEGRDDLFAVGDCAHMTHAPRPKAGVYAVRQAPVLAQNLRAALIGRGGLKPYAPQKGYLKLISLGGKAALAEKAGFTLSGPWLWRVKDRIDRKFMRRLTDLPPMAAPPAPREAAADARDAAPLCTGCGAKVTGDALSQALRTLPPPGRDDVLSRPGDDAAILAHGTGVQVLTTDHLRAVCDDPVLFARIATVHALGDVWAMGASPQAALASVVLPRLSEPLQARTLSEMLEAASAILAAEGCDLVGGHTTMGAEPSFGLTLTGLADAAIRHDGARAGDVLILTRPLGTGVLLAAEMAGAARGADILTMLHAMAAPQGTAARALRPAHAMTDVTGFGLAGHLKAILTASGLSADLDLDAIPAYSGALAALAAGHRSVLHEANARAAPILGPDDPRMALLHDPQTAGGLLAAMSPGSAETALTTLAAENVPAARIGTLTEGSPGIHVR